MIDGVLVIDKPAGMTSHDVVASARRSLREGRIGHTGTLDPMATGVLPLAIGRATRLVQFLTASDKTYIARVQLGLSTDTYDVTGRETARVDARVAGEEVEAALEGFRGTYLQAPPPYSAKKIDNRRAYDLARAGAAVHPAAVPVSVRSLALTRFEDATATLEVTCSAGFYVRSLAHDLGQRLGVGGCLASLRRTRSGEFTLNGGIGLDLLVGDAVAAAARVVPLENLLPTIPALTVTSEGEKRVAHGRTVENAHVQATAASADVAGGGDERRAVSSDWVRLLSPAGTLLALARPERHSGALHPSVVLI